MQNPQNVPDKSERGPRYQAGLLKVVVSHTGIRGVFSQSAQAISDSFSPCRLEFHCAHKFKLNEKVVIDLSIGSVLASELEALITVAERQGDLWYYQADFCFERKHMTSPTISRALLFIEHKLRIQTSYPIN